MIASMTKTGPNAASIRAIEPIYVAAMLEELRLFDVVDRLVQLFQSGLLPLHGNASGRKLYEYWRQQPQRLSRSERRSLYARALGLGGGDEQVTPNREFDDLWRRFISAVSSVAAQPASTVPAERAISQQAARKAGRDLAINLSLHGFGFTYLAASELQAQVKAITGVLSDPEVRAAYGARSMWEVIEKIASTDLGGAPGLVRCRTMAEAGSTIILWLARRARELGRESARPLLGNWRDDRRLMAACEEWLLARGQSDDDPLSGSGGSSIPRSI
jgi:hypothetical protein